MPDHNHKDGKAPKTVHQPKTPHKPTLGEYYNAEETLRKAIEADKEALRRAKTAVDQHKIADKLAAEQVRLATIIKQAQEHEAELRTTAPTKIEDMKIRTYGRSVEYSPTDEAPNNGDSQLPKVRRTIRSLQY